MSAATVFLLSPANCAGTRARLLLHSRTSPLAARLADGGAPLGDVFTFMSSLYFRGKLAYANRFGRALVITPDRGLVPADLPIRLADLEAMARVPVDLAEPRYREPLVRDAGALARALGAGGRAVLLGSIATEKYVGPLLDVFGERLYFPAAFVGRGDMSRGGLLLRCARDGTPLDCVPVRGAPRHGPKPPRLALLAALACLPAAAPAQAAQAAPRDSIVYRLAPTSRLEVHTGKAGLLGFAGHEHTIRAREFTGRVVYYPDSVAASRVAIVIRTGGLEVLTPPDTAEIRKVTADMRSKVLDVERYPEIRFEARTAQPAGDRLRIVAALTITDRTREVPVDVLLHVGADTLRATASFTVKQTDFGIRPARGGPAGTVRVADRVRFEIDAVALRDGAP